VIEQPVKQVNNKLLRTGNIRHYLAIIKWINSGRRNFWKYSGEDEFQKSCPEIAFILAIKKLTCGYYLSNTSNLSFGYFCPLKSCGRRELTILNIFHLFNISAILFLL
jgi:hypothetical protein